MIRFNCDYSEGAHPAVLQKLLDTNLEQTAGYGMDPYCAQAADLIRKKCAAPNAAVHFMVGGTPANVTLIDAVLRRHQSPISADTGHINVHETGAVEFTGHKVLPLPNTDGKITGQQVDALCTAHYADSDREHTTQPKLVYISSPTELGSIYTKAELTALRQACDKHNLYLFLDGARLGYGLAAQDNDLTLADLAQLCDAFYIGGTKNGLLFGEAMVIVNDALKPGFRRAMKRNGAMLAKGRLLGVQFAAAMEHDLWLELGRHADAQAQRIAAALSDRGIAMYVPSPTNQIFPILSDAQIARLQEQVAFYTTARVDAAHQAVRFVTSWATTDAQVDALLAVLAQVLE